MATFTQMKSKVADWLKRSDLSSVVPDFINIARHKLEQSSNFWTMLAYLTGTLTTDTITFSTLENGITDYHSNTYGGSSIPAGTVKAVKYIRITAGGKNYPVQVRDYNELINEYPYGSSVTGIPLYAAVDHIQRKIIFRPYPDSSDYTYEIGLWERHGDLTTDEHTDQTMLYHWDVVLYGALLEASPYLINDPRIATWKMKFDEARALLKVSDTDMVKVGDTARIQPSVTPDE